MLLKANHVIYKKTSMQVVAFHAFHMCVSIQDTIHMGHINDLLFKEQQQ